MLTVIPYHCEALADGATIEPLVEALARVQGSDKRDVEIISKNAEVTEGVEPIIQFVIQAINDPFVQHAAGIFGGALLKRLGSRVADWIWDKLTRKRSDKRAQKSYGIFSGGGLQELGESLADWFWEIFNARLGRNDLMSELIVVPPPSVPADRLFRVSTEIQIRRNSGGEVVFAPGRTRETSSRSEMELREKLVAEFNKIEEAIGIIFDAVGKGTIPKGIRDIRLERNAHGYGMYGGFVDKDQRQVSFYGEIAPGNKLVWRRH
jgi:hypothetical protein